MFFNTVPFAVKSRKDSPCKGEIRIESVSKVKHSSLREGGTATKQSDDVKTQIGFCLWRSLFFFTMMRLLVLANLVGRLLLVLGNVNSCIFFFQLFELRDYFFQIIDYQLLLSLGKHYINQIFVYSHDFNLSFFRFIK